MEIQNDIFAPYHDLMTMEEQSITDLFFDFNIESPSQNFDEFVGSTSQTINNSTANNAVVQLGGTDTVNFDGSDDFINDILNESSGEKNLLEDVNIDGSDDFINDILNDSNGEENFVGNNDHPIGIRDILNDSENVEVNLPANFVGNNDDHPPIGDDFEIPNHDQPPVWTNNPCSSCFVLREMVHTNGFRVMKLELHGEIGIISHAVLNIYDQAVAESAQIPEIYIFDFSSESIFVVKNMLIEYCEMRKSEGYWLIPDSLAHFYDALSVGIDSNKENQLFNGAGGMQQNIPANTEIGESSSQGADKGKGKEKPDKAAQRKRTAVMKLNDFSDNLFDLPIKSAAKAMNVSVTVVKKKCRDGEISRWPGRKIKALKTKIALKRKQLEAARTLHNYSRLSKELEQLDEELSKLVPRATKPCNL